MSLAHLADLLADVVARTGPYAPAVLFGAAFIEYVFPPFPGDALVLLGAWYAVQGQISWPLAYVAVTAGAVLGSVVDWRMGRFLAGHLRVRAAPGGLLDAGRIARFQEAYRRHGPWLLAANRFLPTLRAFVFLAAGASGIRLRYVLLYGGLSAMAWNALLLLVGAFVAKNLDELMGIFHRYTTVVGVLVGLVVGALVVRAVVRRRRARAEAG